MILGHGIRLRIFTALLAATCLTAPNLSAQSAPGPPGAVTHESCVRDTRRLLDAFLGQYDVHPAPGASTVPSDSATAHASIRPELDGCVLEERYEGTRGGEPYAYVALWGTSGEPSHRVQRAFVHSQHGLLGISEGGWNAGGDTLIVGDSALVRGHWIWERRVMTRPTDRGFMVEDQRSEDGGRAWRVILRARYVRR